MNWSIEWWEFLAFGTAMYILGRLQERRIRRSMLRP